MKYLIAGSLWFFSWALGGVLSAAEAPPPQDAAAASDNAGFANCDFEHGIAGWGVWYSDDPKAVMTRYPYAADSAVAHGGRQSLRIVAPDENGCAFVSRGSAAMKPDARYEVGYWFRKTDELDERTFHVRLNFRPADKVKAGWKMKSAELLPTQRKSEGDWHYRRGYVRVPKDAGSPVSLGLYLRAALGTIWIDDVQIREVKPGENLIADLWVYDPYRVDLGSAPLKKYSALTERNAPIHFDVLILPYAVYLDERLQDAVGKWLHAKPRLLVSVGPFGLYDELGRDSGKLAGLAFPGRSLKLEFPDKSRWQWMDNPADRRRGRARRV